MRIPHLKSNHHSRTKWQYPTKTKQKLSDPRSQKCKFTAGKQWRLRCIPARWTQKRWQRRWPWKRRRARARPNGQRTWWRSLEGSIEEGSLQPEALLASAASSLQQKSQNYGSSIKERNWVSSVGLGLGIGEGRRERGWALGLLQWLPSFLFPFLSPLLCLPTVAWLIRVVWWLSFD